MRLLKNLAAVAAVVTIAACGGTTAPASTAYKVGVAFDIGGKGDKSFNDSADRGAMAAAQEFGSKLIVKEVEPNADGSNRKEILDGLASSGYGLVWGIGFLFSTDIAKSAKQNPKTTFAVIDGYDDLCTKTPSNLLCVGFKEEQGSFLVGAAAALKTQSNTVGFVGGLKGDLIKKFQAGYEAGVKWVNTSKGKNVKVLVDYAGDTPQAFRDPAKGKELALKQIGQGADVIYAAAGGTGSGVLAAVVEKKKLYIGVDSDWSLSAKDSERPYILTSMMKRVDNAVQQGIEKYVNGGGKLDGGFLTFGIKEGGIDYAQNQYNKDLLGPIPTTLDDLKTKIKSGEITVPDKPAA
jgi:basic membrane protein A